MENKSENNSISKTCESCGFEFTCQPQNITTCECHKINLSSHERALLASIYNNCICNTCLIKFQNELNYNTTKEPSLSANKNTKRLSILILFLFSSFFGLGQLYPPPVGQVGTTAIDKDSSVFVAWATNCILERGYQNCADKSLGLVTVGEASLATGKAFLNGVVSLGDGGMATCQFKFPIRNGLGVDFAVFENAIDDTFLELAFVEVSSDGVHFVRFKSHSLTDTVIQTNGFGSTDASKINNLAGKYRAGYGTPFDLQELENNENLNINAITHIRIVDVVGSVDSIYAIRDGFGNIINDPWPTPFPSGGFDLDAIGVIHENTALGIKQNTNTINAIIYPNPVKISQQLSVRMNGIKKWELVSLSGVILKSDSTLLIQVFDIPVGIYSLKVETEFGVSYFKLVVVE